MCISECAYVRVYVSVCVLLSDLSYELVHFILGSIKNCVGDGIKNCKCLRERRKTWMDSGNTFLALSTHAPQSPSLTEV
jgi:hypothetical protein